MTKKLSIITGLLFITLTSFTSCSRIDLAVSLANSYITNKVDNYFDLTRTQRGWLKETLSHDIEQVKKIIFPQLASEMFKAADIISTKATIDPAMVYGSYKRLENLFFEGLRIFTPSAVMFVEKLSPDQITHFQKEFDKKVSDLKEESQQKEYTKMKKQFDSWMGSVTSKQKNEIKNFVKTNPSIIDEAVYNRQKMVHYFVNADVSERKNYVKKLFNSYESLKEPSYAKMTEAKSRQVAGFVTSMVNRISPDQKKTLINTIRDRANQLINISRD